MSNPKLFFQKGNMMNWKGGEHKCNGYVYVYSPYHPNKNAMGKGYVKRARLVMEQYLGRFLTRYEIVHHINHIRHDDRLENLVLRTFSRHQSEHQKITASQMNRDEIGRFMS